MAALLLGTVVTPAAVILAVPAPPPLDALLAWPLVLLDRWVGPERPRTTHGTGYPGPGVRLAALLAGILLTWLYYVLLARLMVWWVAARAPDGA